MVTHQLHIVGLPYGDVGDCMDEFLGQAVGKVVTMRPQPTNEVDSRAIRAFDWIGRHVGYVANAELPTAWSILRSRGSHSVRGRVAVVDTEHHCVVVECIAEVINEPAELYPLADFLSWSYDGPVLPKTDEQDRLEFLMDEIQDRLKERDDWNDDDTDDFKAVSQRTGIAPDAPLPPMKPETQVLWCDIVLAMAMVECGLNGREQQELVPFVVRGWILKK